MTVPLRTAMARTGAPTPQLLWCIGGLVCLPLAAMAGIGAVRSPVLVVLGIGGMALFGLAVLSPPAAMAGLLVAAGLVRVQLSTGTGSPIVASLLAALAITVAWIVRMIFRRDLHLVRSPLTFPVVAFATVNVISFIWSRATLDPRISVPATYARVQIAALMVVVLSATVVLIIGGTVRQRRWFVWCLGILFTIGVAHAVLLFLKGPDNLVNGRGLVTTWWVCLAAAQAIVNTRLKWWARVGLGLVCAVWLYQLLSVIDWLSGWLPAVVALFFVLLLRGRVTAIATVIITLLLVVALWGPIYKSVYSDQVDEGSINGSTGRTSLWERTLSTISPSPWLGSGPAGYALALVQFYPNDALSAHSNYVDVIAQSGVIGMAFFTWFFVATLITGWRVQRRLKARGDPFGTALATGIVAGVIGVLVAMALGDWFIPFVYNQTIAGFDHTVLSWFCIGMLVALDTMSRAPQSETSS
jgi:O-antigen ligase